ncbi:AlkA N-terminal domain-containing protein [Pelomonas sp. SE-A7]|uniref:Ada metal-binding domain-containing protein n=1 Tax=Pelomonas sp. SE-A7 TaxID=3054953 RepID=UPI00259D1136|nr:AlkA N-terminal domain-containing protein [Pelomonas sp. SE-A7]MDM4765072.1 AlkA N-terminal domain-containing protein [Pelomonas sp. SE-A7]
MSLDAAHCYPALVARDARFDGRFFVGVTSTGVYCRPVCRVRTPKVANCRFFASAAQAEAERFRPCLKCRPELAPGQAFSVMDASRTLARQAAELINASVAEPPSIEQLAERLGITDRHLRRIFAAEQGVTPLQYLQTRRLLLAKQLLTDSDLNITEVAAASGFASLRRFNAAFLEHYRLQPGSLRKQAASPGSETRALRLGYRPPYAVEALLQFLHARAIPGVEQVDLAARTLSRTLSIEQAGQSLRGHLQLSFDEQRQQALVRLSPSLWPAVGRLLPSLRRWLDLDAEPEVIAEALGTLNPTPGLRLPGCLDRFELAVRAVLGQQVTVAAARTLASRLVQRFGEPLADAPDGLSHLFPRPVAFVEADVSQIAELGIIRRRAETLIALARQWNSLAFAQGSGDQAAAAAELCELPGIGPWTAGYMLMRGWSWPDAFPPGDVVLKKMLDGRPFPQDGGAWQPYRSYAVLQLWREAAAAAPKTTRK